jgi:carboxyl-terminal processing protease
MICSKFSKIILRCFVFAFFGACLCAGFSLSSPAQEKHEKPHLTSEAKEARLYSLRMLDGMKDILKEYYYDQTFGGMNLEARLEAAKVRVKSLEYDWQMYRVLAQVLTELDDSHTKLILPPRADHFQYGVTWQMIGDECYVTTVKKDSDAHVQGIEVGDQIVELGRFKPTRVDLWKLEYVIYRLDPSSSLNLRIRKPDGTEKSLKIKGKVQTEKEFRAEIKARREKNKSSAFKCQEVGTDLIACKLYSFIVEKSDIDKMMKQVRKYPKFILDLRGNGGGFVSIEEYLTSHFFERKVKIADLRYKKKIESRTTKILDADQIYKGDVAILIDSDSASAAEITARFLQIEKRAKVYGDYSSGSVMTSILVPFRDKFNPLGGSVVNVGMSVTIADLIMSDGARLEKKGVVPDEVAVPTGEALKMRLDPVLAFAAYRFGHQLTSEDAGSFQFIADKDEDDERGQSTEDK